MLATAEARSTSDCELPAMRGLDAADAPPPSCVSAAAATAAWLPACCEADTAVAAKFAAAFAFPCCLRTASCVRQSALFERTYSRASSTAESSATLPTEQSDIHCCEGRSPCKRESHLLPANHTLRVCSATVSGSTSSASCAAPLPPPARRTATACPLAYPRSPPTTSASAGVADVAHSAQMLPTSASQPQSTCDAASASASLTGTPSATEGCGCRSSPWSTSQASASAVRSCSRKSAASCDEMAAERSARESSPAATPSSGRLRVDVLAFSVEPPYTFCPDSNRHTACNRHCGSSVWTAAPGDTPAFPLAALLPRGGDALASIGVRLEPAELFFPPALPLAPAAGPLPLPSTLPLPPSDDPLAAPLPCFADDDDAAAVEPAAAAFAAFGFALPFASSVPGSLLIGGSINAGCCLLPSAPSARKSTALGRQVQSAVAEVMGEPSRSHMRTSRGHSLRLPSALEMSASLRFLSAVTSNSSPCSVL
mmetsp:Transcript_58994/g.135279  ORF Transcript_58994/g.135279 Transcript_58994/m.135279 type:complete len:484 (+) Transcript_58994:313-1764(+)